VSSEVTYTMASHADSAHDLLDLDIQTLRQYVDLFPQQGLSKVLTGYLHSSVSKYPLIPDDSEAPDLSEGGVALNVQFTQADCLVMMTVSIL
jgi:superkiller protein 3